MYLKRYYDTIPSMLWKIRHISRVAFLFLYAIYAFTPIHMYAMTGGCNGRPGRLLAGKHASTDIVWANMLFSFFDDDDDEIEAPTADARIFSNAQQGGDIVLVKKRRALVREQFDIKPLFDTKTLPPGGLERPSARFQEYKIAEEPLPRLTDVCLTLNTGLSPPSVIS